MNDMIDLLKRALREIDNPNFVCSSEDEAGRVSRLIIDLRDAIAAQQSTQPDGSKRGEIPPSSKNTHSVSYDKVI